MARMTKPVVLESGDRLSQEEFHRRYSLRPDIRKAELIGGIVYVASPARWDKHGKHQSLVVMWLRAYAEDRSDVGVGDADTVFLTGGNEVQPDAFLFRLSGPGAGARVKASGYIEGAPELVVEVAASSVSYDLHDKKEAYRRAGVPE
jgi:Uma2 family endonuclease